MKRRAIPQFELPIVNEPFKLITDVTIDGDRISKEKQEKENAQREAEQKQERLIEL